MSWKRRAIDLALGLASRPFRSIQQPHQPQSIFVLRNNDIGDVLVTTPLFTALKGLYPSAHLCVGVGPWSIDVLKHNPWVDEVLPLSAPWHNKQSTRHPGNSLEGWRDSVRYIFASGAARELRLRKFDIGIDVLGSPEGALLMLRAGVRYRLGVRGYAGGHTACHRWIEFDPTVHVRRSALNFAELLGAKTTDAGRSEIYLTESEKAEAEAQWREFATPGLLRVVIAPGGGFAEKCWPAGNFAQIAAELMSRGCSLIILGGSGDKALAAQIAGPAPGCSNRAGLTTLRETFALIERADLVVCSASMASHVGAAFRKKVAVGLGPWYRDADEHRRLWGYESDFIQIAPSNNSAERMLREMDRMGWLAPQAQAA